jgi:hypothetical protein
MADAEKHECWHCSFRHRELRRVVSSEAYELNVAVNGHFGGFSLNA